MTLKRSSFSAALELLVRAPASWPDALEWNGLELVRI
jgi:hypothetical protein